LHNFADLRKPGNLPACVFDHVKVISFLYSYYAVQKRLVITMLAAKIVRCIIERIITLIFHYTWKLRKWRKLL